jgi:hypothetical protein
MIRFFLIIFFISFSNQVLASDSQNIINHLQKTNNLTFNFIQSVGEKKNKENVLLNIQKKFYVNMITLIRKLLFQTENH